MIPTNGGSAKVTTKGPEASCDSLLLLLAQSRQHRRTAGANGVARPLLLVWGSWICCGRAARAPVWHQNHVRVALHRPVLSASAAVKNASRALPGRAERRAGSRDQAFDGGLETGDRAPIHSATPGRGLAISNPAGSSPLEQDQGHTPGL